MLGLLLHVRIWSVCKKFDKCKFCENRGPPRIIDKEIGRGTDPMSRYVIKKGEHTKNREGIGTRRSWENRGEVFQRERGTMKKKEERFKEQKYS